MKKTLLTTLALSALFSGVLVFAENDVIIPNPPSLTTVTPGIEREETGHFLRHSKIQSHAETLIKERINSLNANLKVIAADKSLTAEQKASLSTVITTNITGLTALRSSIASSTNATTTKNLTSSIITNFRIYGVVIPQIRIEKRIYDLQNHSVKLSDTFLKVQAKIDEYKGKGKDVTVWQKSLDDAKVLVANDMNILANLFGKVSVLKPSDYGTTSKSVFESTNTSLKTVLKDFNTIKKNLHKPGTLSDSSKKVKGDGKDKYSPLFGTSWVWVSSTASGSTSAAPTGGKFVLSFGEDNRVNSTTDCNGMGGNYTLGASNSMSFGPFMSTKMFCEGSRESEYSSSLMKTSSYKVEGTNLILVNASGTMIFSKK